MADTQPIPAVQVVPEPVDDTTAVAAWAGILDASREVSETARRCRDLLDRLDAGDRAARGLVRLMLARLDELPGWLRLSAARLAESTAAVLGAPAVPPQDIPPARGRHAADRKGFRLLPGGKR